MWTTVSSPTPDPSLLKISLLEIFLDLQQSPRHNRSMGISISAVPVKGLKTKPSTRGIPHSNYVKLFLIRPN